MHVLFFFFFFLEKVKQDNTIEQDRIKENKNSCNVYYICEGELRHVVQQNVSRQLNRLDDDKAMGSFRDWKRNDDKSSSTKSFPMSIHILTIKSKPI